MLVHNATAPLDAFDEVRLHVNATVGDRLRTARHVERTHLVRSRCKTGVGLDLVRRSREEHRLRHAVRRVDDAVQPDDLSETAVRTVDRVPRHLIERSERSTDALLDDKRLFFVAGIRQRTRQRSIDQVGCLDTGLQRGSQHEDFDTRTRLSPTQSHVDLVATALEPRTTYHRADSTCRRVE